jgi:class 3 adenylate cyclase
VPLWIEEQCAVLHVCVPAVRWILSPAVTSSSLAATNGHSPAPTAQTRETKHAHRHSQSTASSAGGKGGGGGKEHSRSGEFLRGAKTRNTAATTSGITAHTGETLHNQVMLSAMLIVQVVERVQRETGARIVIASRVGDDATVVCCVDEALLETDPTLAAVEAIALAVRLSAELRHNVAVSAGVAYGPCVLGVLGPQMQLDAVSPAVREARTASLSAETGRCVLSPSAASKVSAGISGDSAGIDSLVRSSIEFVRRHTMDRQVVTGSPLVQP